MICFTFTQVAHHKQYLGWLTEPVRSAMSSDKKGQDSQGCFILTNRLEAAWKRWGNWIKHRLTDGLNPIILKLCRFLPTNLHGGVKFRSVNIWNHIYWTETIFIQSLATYVNLLFLKRPVRSNCFMILWCVVSWICGIYHVQWRLLCHAQGLQEGELSLLCHGPLENKMIFRWREDC